MLYLRTRDDAELTHATDSTAMPLPLCLTATGRSRLDYTEQREFDPLSGTATTHRIPVEVHRASEVTCPLCADILAPQKIHSLAVPAADVSEDFSGSAAQVVRTNADVPQPQPRRRLRRTT